MGKQCVVIAVFFTVRENGNAVWIGRGIATNRARAWIDGLVLYV